MKSNYAPTIKSALEYISVECEDAYFPTYAFDGSQFIFDEVGQIMNSVLAIPIMVYNIEDEIRKIFKKALNECIYRHGN